MSRIFTGGIRQNGYVVDDIQAAMDHWITVMGVGPWLHLPTVKFDWFTYRGTPSAMQKTTAVAVSGNLMIELIQPLDDEPSMYKEFTDAGLTGLQHVAFWTTDFDKDHARAVAHGYRVGQKGQVGGPGGRFCFFDTGRLPGTVIELSETSEHKAKVFEMLKEQAARWDGSDPIRTVG